MRQFIHHAYLGMAFEDGLHVHLLENRSPVFHVAARNQNQPLRLRNRILASMGFEITNHHVDATFEKLVGVRQHLVGFPHPGGKSQIDFKPAVFMRS